MSDNPLLRKLTLEHGTGLAARANETGDHAMAAGLMDTYATNGQTVPAHLASSISRLNEITQQESLLAKSSAGGRAALSGTGYDPVAIRKEAADLERYLLEQSADARNVGARVKQETDQANLQRLETANQLSVATLDSRTRATISGFEAQIAQDAETISEIEDGQAVRASADFVDKTGASMDDLYEIYASNDPALMKQTFGTANRRHAHKVLQFMQLSTNEQTAARVQGMTAAASMAATQLAGDPAVTTDDMMAMLAGNMEPPEGVSLLAIKEAVQERESVLAARTAMTQAKGTNNATEAAYRTLAIEGLTDFAIADIIAGQLSNAGEVMPADLIQALASGEIADVAEAVLEATNGGTQPLSFTTEGGEEIQVSAQEMLEVMTARHEEKEIRVAGAIMSNSRMMNYTRELQENTRVSKTVEGMLGVPIPSQVQLGMEARYAEARQLYVQAAKATTNEERLAFEQGAMQLMEQGRELLFDYAKLRGVPEDFREDIKQGRFASDRTYKAGQIQLLDSLGTASNSPLGRFVGGVMKESGIDRAVFQEWARGDSVDPSDMGLEVSKITAAVDAYGYQALAAAAVQELASNQVFQNLPDGARAVLDEALSFDPELMKEAELSPANLFKNLIAAVQVADGMMTRADREAMLGGATQSQYAQGSLMSALTEGLNNRQLFENALAPEGKLDRATASLLTMYIGDRSAVETSGENAIAFEDLPAVAAKVISDQLRMEMVGASLQPVSALAQSAVRKDARTITKFLPHVGEGFLGLAVPAETTQIRSQVEVALETIYMRKLINQNEDRSQVFGYNLPSLSDWFPTRSGLPVPNMMNAIGTWQEVVEQLELNGNTDAAQRIRQNWEN